MISHTHLEVVNSHESLPQLDTITDQSSREEKRQAIERLVRSVCDQRRQELLDQDFHVDDEFVRNNPDAAQALKDQFLEAKKGLNIGETFALSLQEPYFGRIYLTKLASTDHAVPDASRQMFEEMRDFVDWMRKVGPLKGVDPYDSHYGASTVVGEDALNSPDYNFEDEEDFADRWRSGRWMTYSYFRLPHVSEGDEDGDRVAIERFRPFANARTIVRDVSCSVQVYKHTVFTMPRSLFLEIRSLYIQAPQYSSGPDGSISHELMRVIERYMYTDAGKDVVRRIHTSVYSAVCPTAMVDAV